MTDAVPKRQLAIKMAAIESAGPARGLTPEQLRQHIEVAAYFIAEQKGFPGDTQLQDWLEAARQIDAMLACGKLP